MLTLILETSTEKGCILLADSATPIAFQKLPAGPELSRCLALEVKKLLDNKIPDRIAVGTGPGSYTGIRVGAALAKALSYGWNIPMIGFCSLKAFGPAPILVDARMGGIYALLNETPTLLSPSDSALESLPHFSSPHPEVIKKRLNSSATWREAEIDSSWLASLVFQEFQQQKSEPFELIYLSSP